MVTINDAAFERFMRGVNDALVSYWQKPGLATSIARTGSCATGQPGDGACRALARGVYLDEHRAVVVARVKTFNLVHTAHTPLASSCNSVRPLDEISAAQDFGCALQEVRSRAKHGRNGR